MVVGKPHPWDYSKRKRVYCPRRPLVALPSTRVYFGECTSRRGKFALRKLGDFYNFGDIIGFVSCIMS